MGIDFELLISGSSGEVKKGETTNTQLCGLYDEI